MKETHLDLYDQDVHLPIGNQPQRPDELYRMVTRSHGNNMQLNRINFIVYEEMEKVSFDDLWNEEIEVTLEFGCFEFTSMDGYDGHRIYLSRLVDVMKPGGTNRSKLFVTAYNDESIDCLLWRCLEKNF